MCCGLQADAQRIVPIFDEGDSYPFSYFNQDIQTFCSFENKIYLAGRNLSAFGEMNVNKVIAWDGAHYSTVGNNDLSLPISHHPRHLYVWRDTLHLLTSAYPDESLIYAFHPSTGTWHTRGDTLDVRGHQLFTWNNELWLATYQGALWRWSQNEWTSAIASPVAALRSVAVWNGQVYLAGVTSAIDRLFLYSNNTWQSIAVPDGAKINSFAPLNGAIYACGSFDFGNGTNGLAELVGSTCLPTTLFAYAPAQEAHQCADQIFTLVKGASSNDFDICLGENIITKGFRVNAAMVNYGLSFQNTLFLPSHETYFSSTNAVYFTSNIAVLHKVMTANTATLQAGALTFNTSGSPMIGINHRDYSFQTLFNKEDRFYKMLHVSSLWLNATINGDTAMAFRTLNNTQQMDSWFFGPVGQVLDDAYMNKYARAWRISADEIQTHQTHFSDENYRMPEAIANWPAHGNFQNGEAFHLAPFFDVNENSLYEPHQGDYPIIPGDHAIFMMMNDALDVADVPGTVPFNAEVQLFFYTRNNDPQPALHIHGTLINRSENTWNNTLLGVYNEWSIGYDFNDYQGVDSLLNYVYAYDYTTNNDDEFNHRAPAAACAVLSDNIRHNVFFGYNNNVEYSIPTTTAQRVNYMHGLTRTGNAFEGTDVVDPAWQYSGDACVGETDSEWINGTPDGRSFSLSTIEQGDMPPGSFQCFDLALFAAFDSSLVDLGNLCTLDEAVVSMQQTYSSTAPMCGISTHIDDIKQQPAHSLQVWPNPACDQLHLQLDARTAAGTVAVFDLLGKEVLTTQVNAHIINLDIGGFNDGFYMVRYTDGHGIQQSAKWLKQSQ